MALKDIWQRLMKDDTEKFLRSMVGQDKQPAAQDKSGQDEDAAASKSTGPSGGSDGG